MMEFIKYFLAFAAGTWFGVGIMALMSAASDEDDRMEETDHGK